MSSRSSPPGPFSPPAKSKRKGPLKGTGGRPPAVDVPRRAAFLREVALEVFTEFGYENASLGEIARRAGASKDTLYSHYKNKADLFVTVVGDYMESRMGSFDRLNEEHGSLERNLKHFAFQLLASVLEDGRNSIILIVFSEANRFPELGKRFWEFANQRGEDAVSNYFDRQIAHGLLRREDPDRMAREFLYLVSARVILRHLLNIESSLTATQRREQANAAVDMFLRAYQP